MGRRIGRRPHRDPRHPERRRRAAVPRDARRTDRPRRFAAGDPPCRRGVRHAADVRVGERAPRHRRQLHAAAWQTEGVSRLRAGADAGVHQHSGRKAGARAARAERRRRLPLSLSRNGAGQEDRSRGAHRIQRPRRVDRLDAAPSARREVRAGVRGSLSAGHLGRRRPARGRMGLPRAVQDAVGQVGARHRVCAGRHVLRIPSRAERPRRNLQARVPGSG
jgi:hypothetical protein